MQLEASLRFTVGPDDIDEFEHANHAVYLRWLDDLAWAQLGSVELDKTTLVATRLGMVARRHVISFSSPAYAGEEVVVSGTLNPAGPFTLKGICEIMSAESGRRLTVIESEWVWYDIARRRPSRLPSQISDL